MTDSPDRIANRETDVIRAFVELSNELVDGYDMIDLLTNLTQSCARLLDVASAGLLLTDEKGALHFVAASSERTHNLELFQLQRDEGPCLDCFHGGKAVNVPDLSAATGRWPVFCQRADRAGFASVHALPMRLRGNVLGALGLFGETVGSLTEPDLALAQALAHVACVAIVNEKAAEDRTIVISQLQHALASRIALEQAKGVVASSGGLEMEEAFAVLRRYARDHGQKLSAVAAQVVNRELRGETLVQHARSAAVIT
ncbi:GAF and ANTAR domain-containing protein [Nocardioides sp.]|uniref:GAF and ANTAR domain-containing protein n=1 Tax=Nocardioides sp. TaxID=35761 RepID=UPI002C295F25|nr:GAF and ANTAR domain-containing protein [Nocardioides sp.]HXH78451.1 GAF and ANTAR domain-containing protein [Nocardioides sp.]